MTLSVDTGNIVADKTSFSGTATSTSVTVGASDNLLLVAVGNNYNTTPFNIPPDGFTYNGVALTLLGFEGNAASLDVIAYFYLSSPPVGTFTLAGTWTTNTGGGQCCVTAIPISGAATSSIFGTLAKAHSESNNTPAVTAVGGVTGSLYVAGAINNITTTTGSGAGQTDISSTVSVGGANVSFTVSTIAGSGTGAFTWVGSGTSANTSWAALGININAGGGAATPFMGQICM